MISQSENNIHSYPKKSPTALGLSGGTCDQNPFSGAG